MARAFSPDELFAAVDERMECSGYLRKHAGRHVTTPSTAEAAEMLKRQPGKQGVLDYDGMRAPVADENGIFQSSYKQRRAKRSK